MAYALTRLVAGAVLAAISATGPAAATDGAAPSAACRTYRAQVAAEALAWQVMHPPPVRKARDEAGAQWRQAWGPVAPEAAVMFPEALDELAFNAALKAVVQATHPPAMTLGVNRPVTRGALHLPGTRYGWDNTDNIYGSIPVDPRASYLISGQLAEGTNMNLSLWTGDGRVLSNLAKADIKADATGRFTLSVGPAKGNDIRLPADASHIMVRETMADWDRARPVYLDVVQSGGPAHETPTLDAIAAKTARSVASMVGNMKSWRTSLYRKNPPNVFTQPWLGLTSNGGLPNQAYSIGYYELADDVALVFKIQTGGAEYFSFQLSNIWGTSGNFIDNVSTLTNRQAHPDKDGGYSFVVSARDPGIANWISTQGWHEGDITLRWQGLTGTPAVTAQKVAMTALSTALAPGTPSFSPEKRQTQIAARAANPYGKWMDLACDAR